jgi:hypothetical protein
MFMLTAFAQLSESSMMEDEADIKTTSASQQKWEELTS